MTCVLVFEFTKRKRLEQGRLELDTTNVRPDVKRLHSQIIGWFSASQHTEQEERPQGLSYFLSTLSLQCTRPSPSFFAYGKRLNMARPGRKAVTVQGSQKTGSLAHVTYLVYYMHVKTQFLTRQRNCYR